MSDQSEDHATLTMKFLKGFLNTLKQSLEGFSKNIFDKQEVSSILYDQELLKCIQFLTNKEGTFMRSLEPFMECIHLL